MFGCDLAFSLFPDDGFAPHALWYEQLDANKTIGPSVPPMMETAAEEPASRPVAECECVYRLQKIYLHIFHQVIGG